MVEAEGHLSLAGRCLPTRDKNNSLIREGDIKRLFATRFVYVQRTMSKEKHWDSLSAVMSLPFCLHAQCKKILSFFLRASFSLNIWGSPVKISIWIKIVKAWGKPLWIWLSRQIWDWNYPLTGTSNLNYGNEWENHLGQGSPTQLLESYCRFQLQHYSNTPVWN